MEKTKALDKKSKVTLGIITLATILVLGLVTYAFFTTNLTNDDLLVTTETGSMKLDFADKNNSLIVANLTHGNSVIKTFTITNKGTLDVYADLFFKNLVNTYTNGSFTYTLEYSDEEEGTYIELVTDKKVPTGPTEFTAPLAEHILIKANPSRTINKTYYFNLIITLNYLDDVNQDKDFEGRLSTKFEILESIGSSPLLATETIEKFDTIEINEAKTPEQLTTIGYETIENYSNTTSTFDIDSYSSTLYIKYAETYNFDETTGKFSLESPKTIVYNEDYNQLKNTYVRFVDPSSEYTVTNDSTTNLDIIFKITDATYDEDTQTGTISYYDIRKNEIQGLYPIQDNYGTSYIFKGNVTNNYVKFGKIITPTFRGYSNDNKTSFKEYNSLTDCENAETYKLHCEEITNRDLYWRILRINGDGTLRLMYDGTEPHENNDSSIDRTLESVRFNKYENYFEGYYYQYKGLAMTNAGIGYMYGDYESTTYSDTHKNQNDSDMKKYLDQWYEKNLIYYNKYISDEIFCNDREIESGTGIGKIPTTYKALTRITNNEASLICNQKNDAFTVNDIEKGNGALTYPIGLITADEFQLINIQSFNNYLYRYRNYWTMTPVQTSDISSIWAENYFVMSKELKYGGATDSCYGNPYYTYTYNDGITPSEESISATHSYSTNNPILMQPCFAGGSINDKKIANGTEFPIAPVINIKSEYINRMTGTGTMTDPYVINVD